MNFRKSILCFVSTFAVAATLANPANAQFFSTPNYETGLGAKTATLKGTTFTNYGLIGAGRVRASAIDFNGDTLGSFSGMALDLSSWRKTGSGYSGLLLTLPDRGYNDLSFSNYAARVNAFNFTFTPFSGGTLAQDPASQNQVNLTYNASKSFFLTDFNGVRTTGEDPASGKALQNGFTLPVVQAGLEGAGKVSIDAEAIAFHSDGTFYVGDEYSSGIYYFDKTGKMIGFIAPLPALAPMTNGVLNYNSLTAPTTGRRNNQGIEAVSLSPDGTRLFSVLQSATVQDSTDSQQARLNTRVMVYDVSSNKTPQNPIGHYILKLPTFDRDGTGGSADRTAAQSEIMLLNNSQFLMLTRDGNGVDNGDNRPIVFKSIFLVDVSEATNIAGTSFETSTAAAAPVGVLNTSITAAQSIQLVNMLNTDQLTRLGLNLGANSTNLVRANNPTTISEKWEAMALAPTLDENAPQDFFLFVGNDNDFITRTGVILGDAQYATYDAETENDSMLLVYRLNLPTYVDANYLASMKTTAPLNISVLGASINDIGQENSINIVSHLDAERHIRLSNEYIPENKLRVWGAFGNTSSNADKEIDLRDYSFGLGYRVMPELEIGAVFGAQSGDGDGGAFSFDLEANKYSLYAGYDNSGYFGSVSLTLGEIKFGNIVRPAAYGLTGVGNTKGDSVNFRLEAGKLFDFGNWQAGPIVGARNLLGDVDAFIEAGAAGGNVSYNPVSYKNQEVFVGAEAIGKIGNLTPSLRLSHHFNDAEFDSVNARLASAQSSLGSIIIDMPTFGEDQTELDLGLTGQSNDLVWRLSYKGLMGADSNDWSHHIGATISYNF